MSWLSKIFGGKKEEIKAEVPASSPEVSEIPMSGSMPEEKVSGEEAAEEAGSEEMK